ncbi:hypothetical protein GJ744_010308 [Endocarpon pusillum]|uniref:Uncharacterized protein n=1 Tax=Endocarpon pusillum TaxID=364733 RepID=A0A8H7AIA3_9EURO|nr:hypothetical protein GJ744_010308 [Endocarpon pusillum]
MIFARFGYQGRSTWCDCSPSPLLARKPVPPAARGRTNDLEKSAKWKRQLIWRDFAIHLGPSKQRLLEDHQVKDTDIAREWTPLNSSNAACLPPRVLPVILEESTQYHERKLPRRADGVQDKGADIIVALTTSG